MKPDARYERLLVLLADAKKAKDFELAQIAARQLAMYTRRRRR